MPNPCAAKVMASPRPSSSNTVVPTEVRYNANPFLPPHERPCLLSCAVRVGVWGWASAQPLKDHVWRWFGSPKAFAGTCTSLGEFEAANTKITMPTDRAPLSPLPLSLPSSAWCLPVCCVRRCVCLFVRVRVRWVCGGGVRSLGLTNGGPHATKEAHAGRWRRWRDLTTVAQPPARARRAPPSPPPGTRRASDEGGGTAHHIARLARRGVSVRCCRQSHGPCARSARHREE